AADGHVVGRSLTEELCDRAAIAGQGKTQRFTSEADGAKTRSWQSRNQACDLDFRALDAVRTDVLRVHALRVVEHDHAIEVRRWDEACPASVLRPGQCDERQCDRKHYERALGGASPTGAGREQ